VFAPFGQIVGISVAQDRGSANIQCALPHPEMSPTFQPSATFQISGFVGTTASQGEPASPITSFDCSK